MTNQSHKLDNASRLSCDGIVYKRRRFVQANGSVYIIKTRLQLFLGIRFAGSANATISNHIYFFIVNCVRASACMNVCVCMKTTYRNSITVSSNSPYSLRIRLCLLRHVQFANNVRFCFWKRLLHLPSNWLNLAFSINIFQLKWNNTTSTSPFRMLSQNEHWLW